MEKENKRHYGTWKNRNLWMFHKERYCVKRLSIRNFIPSKVFSMCVCVHVCIFVCRERKRPVFKPDFGASLLSDFSLDFMPRNINFSRSPWSSKPVYKKARYERQPCLPCRVSCFKSLTGCFPCWLLRKTQRSNVHIVCRLRETVSTVRLTGTTCRVIW